MISFVNYILISLSVVAVTTLLPKIYSHCHSLDGVTR